MSYLTKTAAFLLVALYASTTLAAGDYILEAKFKRELPKAEQGDPKAQYAVGEMYEKGKGTAKDEGKAFDWYWKAANKNNKKAAYKVGLFHYNGIVVKRDYKKAHTWFTKSAEKDYVRAQYYLGELYEHGRGVSKNNKTALEWYKRALAGGYGAASDGILRVTKSKEKKKFLSRPKVSPDARQVTKNSVLRGGWKKRNRPAEYLPSELTNCKAKKSNIECLSKDITRNIGMADITYTIKAVLFSFTGDNFFKVSYRNNVSKIDVTDEEFVESGGKVPVKIGWQDAEHKLSCELEDNKNITCTKNKLRKIKLTR